MSSDEEQELATDCDLGNAWEMFVEREYERASRMGPQRLTQSRAVLHRAQDGSSCDEAAVSLFAVTNGLRFNASIAGRPPQRKRFGPKGSAVADEEFRVARARWFEKLTGRRLDRNELSLREQVRMCDAIARAFRVYTDGRRSLAPMGTDEEPGTGQERCREDRCSKEQMQRPRRAS